jgi:fructose-1,6-bisphosphatase/inositol monophosphatase family enzyme
MASVDQALLAGLQRIGAELRDRVVAICEERSSEALATVAAEAESDTQYEIDRLGEAELVALVDREIGDLARVVVVAEGLPPEGIAIGRGSGQLRLLVDPIDGTRGLMHQKRPAWVLMALAPDRGAETRLSHTLTAVQTEIPLIKQHLSDQLWWADGQAGALRRDRTTEEERRFTPRPSRATRLEHGFASVCRFFPKNQEPLGRLADRLYEALLGPSDGSRALCFEDQYISTGGQLYEIVAGHDLFVVDVRPLLGPSRLACHPYDICTMPIARAFGVVITDSEGGALDAPFDTTTPVAFVAYANEALRNRVEPILLPLLRDLETVTSSP